MHELNFIKMEGLGNDYIFVDMMQKNGIDETKITKVSVFKRTLSKRFSLHLFAKYRPDRQV